MNLPKDILFYIFEFGGKNTFYLDKNLLHLVNEKRKYFIQNPITIHYSLIRFTKRQSANVMRNHRPSICFESEKTIDISSNINIGIVNLDGTIIPSKELENIIILGYIFKKFRVFGILIFLFRLQHEFLILHTIIIHTLHNLWKKPLFISFEQRTIWCECCTLHK